MALAAASAAMFLWLGWWSLRAGTSRLVSGYAVRARSAEVADVAAGLAPSDPEGPYARAVVLTNAGDLEGAARAYEQAVGLRPRDYVLWLELGKVRDRSGDAAGALKAFGEAVRLAPFYAQPRWQLGQALLRAARTEEAAAELRRAAESDPTLYPNLVQTLWHAGGRDSRALAGAARPRTTDETLAVVKFLIKAGAAGEAVRLLRESGATLPAEARRALVADLLAAEEFAGAYEVWSEGSVTAPGVLADGGFEGEAGRDDDGFGWRFAREAQGLRLSLDTDSPREGSRSLKVEYAGASDPAAPAVSRLVTVEPGALYRLTFSARTRGVVTGGPPFVQVESAGKSGEVIARLPPLPPTTQGWQEFSLEFNAPAAGAVRLALKRQPCTSEPCPAFGGVWLDAFGLKKL